MVGFYNLKNSVKQLGVILTAFAFISKQYIDHTVMFLTTKGRYAVMVMVELAAEFGRKPVNSELLAARLNVDKVYLEKILSKLRGGRMVNSTRGPGGGYSLSRSGEEIKILDIMMVADENIKMTKCPKDGFISCMGGSTSRCNSHHLWVDLECQIRDFLSSKTLDSLNAPRATLCEQKNEIKADGICIS
jgi:Rrf2 family iron-sulfur cluster assembly transcriptional regulator